MSTNDDSASRRGRRAEPGDRRGPLRPDRDDRWDQSSSSDRPASDAYQEPRRDGQPQRPFSRHPYQNPQEPVPPQPPQGRYPEPPLRNDPGLYAEPSLGGYTPPPPPYEREPAHPHLGFHDSGRDDLFVRDSEPSPFGQNGYGSQNDYQDDFYDQKRPQQPMTPPNPRRDEPQYPKREAAPPPAEDYDRSFQARTAQDAQSRFFLPGEDSPKPRAAQPERGYVPPSPPQHFQESAYSPQDHYEDHYEDGWADEHGHEHEDGAAPHELAHQESELDEDFFADEDELESEHIPAKKSVRKRYMIAALAGAMMIGGGGAYVYKWIKGSGGGEESATALIRADNRPLKELPANAGGKQFPNGEKTIYDRLTPDGQQIQAAYAAPPPVAPPPAPQTPQAAPGNSLEERIDEALRKAQQSNDAPPPPASAPVQTGGVPDQPTVVRSESYRPDGTRVDAGRPMVMPSVADANSGQLPPPFGNAVTTSPSQPAVVTPFRTTVPTTPSPQLATATPAPRASASGYWVSLKSAADEKAIQRDLTILTDKYKSVLGDVPLTSKIADLGAKGVHYRAVAGPFNSRQEALDLCQRIKGVGGDKACFVTN